jgi:plastocyanin
MILLYGAATKQTQAPTEEVIEFTADKVGSFEYYCSVGSHRQMGMKGVLKVAE